MTTTIDVEHAGANLTELIERALAGERVVITRRGEPVVRLQPTTGPRRSFADLRGSAPGLLVAADFDDLPDDAARSLGIRD